MKKVIINCLVLLLILSVFATTGFCNLEVFTRYNTNINVNANDTLEVSKHIYLRNIHDVGIVPGEIQFKVYNPGTKKDVEIKNINVTNRYKHPIKHKLINTDDGYVVMLDIFTPVLPGSEYVINLDFEVAYEPTGFLFKNLEIPLYENSTIPITSGEVTLNLPNWHHLTYTSFSGSKIAEDDGSVIWKIDKDAPQSIRVEYSVIPIKLGNLKGSLVFWIVVNIILVSLLVVHIKKAFLRNNAGTRKRTK